MPADIVLDGELLRFLGGDGDVERLRIVPADGALSLVAPNTDAPEGRVVGRLHVADADEPEGRLELRSTNGERTLIGPASLRFETAAGDVALRARDGNVEIDRGDGWVSLSDALDELTRLRGRVDRLEKRLEALESDATGDPD